jgi:hypothetical protein
MAAHGGQKLFGWFGGPGGRSKADIGRLIKEYRSGQFEHLSSLRHPMVAAGEPRST